MRETFIFIDVDRKEESIVINSWKKAVGNFNKYFPLKGECKIVTINDFDKYCQIVGETRPKWGVSKQKLGNIFLYNPMEWTKQETGHDLKDVVPSLVHELFHVYCYKNKPDLPIWLEEGIATYLSQDFDGGQKDIDFNKLKKIYIKIPDLPNLEGDFSTHTDHAWSYLSAFTFIKYLTKIKGNKYIKKIPKEYKAKNKLFIKEILSHWKRFKEKQYEQ